MFWAIYSLVILGSCLYSKNVNVQCEKEGTVTSTGQPKKGASVSSMQVLPKVTKFLLQHLSNTFFTYKEKKRRSYFSSYLFFQMQSYSRDHQFKRWNSLLFCYWGNITEQCNRKSGISYVFLVSIFNQVELNLADCPKLCICSKSGGYKV